MLIAVNHGFAGGAGAERLVEQLQAAIRGAAEQRAGARRWRESKGSAKPSGRRPV